MGLFERIRSLVGGGSDDDAERQEETGTDDAGPAEGDATSGDATGTVAEDTDADGTVDATGDTDADGTVDPPTTDGSAGAGGESTGGSESEAEDEEPVSWEETGFEQLTTELTEEDDPEGEDEPVDDLITEAETDAGADEPGGTDGDLRLPLEEGPTDTAPDDDDAVEETDEGIPEEGPRAEFVADARELAEFWSEYDLDFSAASLDRLDAYIDEQWSAERFEDVEFGGEDYDSAVFTDQIRQVGSYLGEVLVRTQDGEWVERAGVGWLVALGEDGEAVPVFHIVQESLAGEASVLDTVDAVLGDRDSGQ